MVVSLPAMISRKQEADHLLVVERVGAGARPAQRSREIVGRVAGRDRGAPIGHEVAEVLVEMRRGRDAGGRDVGHAFVAIEQRVRPDAELFLVVLRNAEHARDHVHREAGRVVGDEIAARPSATSPARNSLRERADLGLEIGDAPRRERAAHQPAQTRCDRADRS